MRDLGMIEDRAADAQEPHRVLLGTHLGKCAEEYVEVLVPPALTYEQDVRLRASSNGTGMEELFTNAKRGYHNRLVEGAIVAENVRFRGV
jgi:hypothetical protein